MGYSAKFDDNFGLISLQVRFWSSVISPWAQPIDNTWFHWWWWWPLCVIWIDFIRRLSCWSSTSYTQFACLLAAHAGAHAVVPVVQPCCTLCHVSMSLPLSTHTCPPTHFDTVSNGCWDEADSSWHIPASLLSPSETAAHLLIILPSCPVKWRSVSACDPSPLLFTLTHFKPHRGWGLGMGVDSNEAPCSGPPRADRAARRTLIHGHLPLM